MSIRATNAAMKKLSFAIGEMQTIVPPPQVMETLKEIENWLKDIIADTGKACISYENCLDKKVKVVH